MAIKIKRWRDLVNATMTLVVIALLSLTPAFDRLDALSSDMMLALRHAVFGQKYPASTSPTVLVALDELTYRTPPFANLPKVLWTPQVAKVQDAILASGAKVIGYDVIFPTSLESYLPDYERPFLKSLMAGGRAGRVVLGKVQHSDAPVSPYPAQSMVVGNARNIRSLNVHSDMDDVVRHLPLFFKAESDGINRDETSMALELAARAVGKAPESRSDGSVVLGNYTIPGSQTNAMRINFQGGDDIPIYSMADLYACAEAGESGYFERHFKDKVVILGEILDVEDRKLTAKRLMTGSGQTAIAPFCRLFEDLAGKANSHHRDTIPGAYIHASAVNDLLRSDALREIDRTMATAMVTFAVLLVLVLSLWMKPIPSAIAVGGFAFVWVLSGLWALQMGQLLPVLPVLIAIALGYTTMLLYRYMVSDQQELRIRRLFSLYLAPAVVDRMMESDHLPELGGEIRRVTIWFSDVADFLSLSEGLTPSDLVSLMNRYFTAVTEIIEAHGGFVDKYIGDAVVAVFGAPLDDPNHARNALYAVLAVRERLRELNATGQFGDRQIVARTGLNSGESLIGNVGSSRRFNYTVMGDTVNLASRLEGANKAVGTLILVSESVVEQLPDDVVLREVGMIQVKGRQAPVRVFEPLAAKGYGDVVQALRLADAFAQAMICFREGRFTDVARALSRCPADDPAVIKLHVRAAAFALAPPPPGWVGVETLAEK